jgi:hypothetical protein
LGVAQTLVGLLANRPRVMTLVRRGRGVLAVTFLSKISDTDDGRPRAS